MRILSRISISISITISISIRIGITQQKKHTGVGAASEGLTLHGKAEGRRRRACRTRR